MEMKKINKVPNALLVINYHSSHVLVMYTKKDDIIKDIFKTWNITYF